MAEVTLSNEFYWSNVVIKVEDNLFSVPRYDFVQSSEVFADMFLLPSGPAAHSEGRDKEHPLVLEGYKKDEFVCLLKVMYPTSGSLISGTNLDLRLEKEEWVSVLKLSTIWNMDKIRKYAIHRLSTDAALSPIEKIQLARAHKVAAWLDEGVTSLVSGNPKPTLADLITLGWETAARILWIRDGSRASLDASNILHFTKDAIKCARCASSLSLMNSSHTCHSGHALPADAELTHPGPGSVSGTTDRLVSLRGILCGPCRGGTYAFYNVNAYCNSCSNYTYANQNQNVRITPNIGSKEMIKEMFGDEINDYEPATMVA